MLERLSARTHEVQTRFAVGEACGSAPPLAAKTVVTRVTFRAIGEDEARAYVASGEGRDTAGGYAVQGGAGPFVARVDGSYSNVVGLPEDEVVEALRSLAPPAAGSPRDAVSSASRDGWVAAAIRALRAPRGRRVGRRALPGGRRRLLLRHARAATRRGARVHPGSGPMGR